VLFADAVANLQQLPGVEAAVVNGIHRTQPSSVSSLTTFNQDSTTGFGKRCHRNTDDGGK